MKTIILVLILLVMPGIVNAKHFTSPSIPGDATKALPLIASIPQGSDQRCYVNAVWAVDVISVECDGVKVKPISRNILFDDPNFRSFPARGDVVYQIRLADFKVASFFSAKSGEYSVVSYDISPTAKNIVVKYKIRFPDGSVSEDHLLECVSIESLAKDQV